MTLFRKADPSGTLEDDGTIGQDGLATRVAQREPGSAELDPGAPGGGDVASIEPDEHVGDPREQPSMLDELADDESGGVYGSTRRPPPWPLIAIVALSVLALVLALFGLQQHSQRQREQDQTAQLKRVSGQLVGALTTYDYQHLADWQKAVLANATGSFRNGFNDRFSSVSQLLTATHNRATSTVQGTYVGDVQNGKASTIVVVNVTVTGLSGTRQFGSYDKLSVLKVNGRWQVDDIETLNFDPTTGTAVTPATPGATQPSASAPATTAPGSTGK